MKILNLTILLVLVTSLYSCSTGVSKDVKNQVVTSVEVIDVEQQLIKRSHKIPSTLMAQNRANLSFQFSGTVNQVLVKIGEKVEQDQALMSLYNPNLDPTLASNLAQLDSIKAQIFQTNRDLKSLKELRKKHSASKNAYEQKETQLKDFQAQKKSIEAQIELAEANQSESIITAPFDSTVVSMTKQLGEFVAAGQVALVVNQQDVLETEVNLTKSLWKNISIGESVTGIIENQKYIFEVIEKAQVADASSRLFKVILQLQGELENVIGQQVTLRIPEKFHGVYQ
jgi:RND family efflux transporter MFP subunit